MNKKIEQIVLIIFVIALIVCSYLANKVISKDTKGNVNIIGEYNKIIFNNALVNSDDGTSIRIENNTIHIEIPNINEYKDTKEISFDATNIGNSISKIKKITYDNINTDVEKENVTVETNFNEGNIIKGGSIENIKFFIEYTGEAIENEYYNFDINYIFE